MKNRKSRKIGSAVKIGGSLLFGMFAPSIVHACACGCGVFDVATSSMFPTLGNNGMAFLQYDYQDQNRNWSGGSTAPADNNDDKEIATHFTTLGVQYMFNSSWGAQVEVPYDFRSFKTLDDNTGQVVTRNWNQLGDIRLEGIYTGFFADQSAGVTFGVKLPTGDFNYDPDIVDRDSQIGTGSTDILLGGFYRGNITQDEKWDWFAQGLLDVPTLIQGQYRPGVELDTAAGIDYKGFSLWGVRISPVAQAIFSYRSADSGANAAGGANDDPADGVSSGYERIMLSPGIEFHIHPVKIYADAEIPVLQNFTGNQLAAPVLFKISVSYMF
jgi:hypothetical protein